MTEDCETINSFMKIEGTVILVEIFILYHKLNNLDIKDIFWIDNPQITTFNEIFINFSITLPYLSIGVVFRINVSYYPFYL